MKIAYLFFNGQLRGSKKFYSNLIEKQKGDIYCADGGANIAYQLNLIPKEIYGDLDSIKDEVKSFMLIFCFWHFIFLFCFLWHTIIIKDWLARAWKNKQPIFRVAKEETEDGFNGFYTNIFK